MSFKIPCGGFELDEKFFSLDENDVLSVSGGGSNFVVNFSSADMQTWTCDKTLVEITEAVNSGKNVIGLATLGGDGIKVDFIGISPNGEIRFGRVFPDTLVLQSYYFLVFEDKVEATLAYIQMTALGG